MDAPRYLLRSVVVQSQLQDVLVTGSRIAAIGAPRTRGILEVDGRGGELLPGLHDHHIHLFATAAANASVDLAGLHRDALAVALAEAPGVGWIRGVGYDETTSGVLGRTILDALTDRPTRIQHRSGALWYLNTPALGLLGLSASHPDGLLWRSDTLIRERLDSPPPDLTALGARLARSGITGVTDATPGSAAKLAAAVWAIPQRVLTMGVDTSGVLALAPFKIVVDDHDLPDLHELAGAISAVHDSGRPVGLHSVTRASLFLVLAALEMAGVKSGDRIEHAAVAVPAAVASLARLGVTVVTQPSLVARRGHRYLDHVEPDDLPYLWPYQSLLQAGVPVGCGSDAPYGDLDPWASIRAARDRLSPDGRPVAAREGVEPAVALDAFLSDPLAPGGPLRRVEVGAPADLVLLDGASGDFAAERVRLTIIDGRVVYDRDRQGGK